MRIKSAGITGRRQLVATNHLPGEDPMNRRKFLKMAELAGIGPGPVTATPSEFDRKAWRFMSAGAFPFARSSTDTIEIPI